MIPLWAQVAGVAAAVASITSSSTQTARLFRVRTAEGISPTTWILLSVSSLSWFAYGVAVRSPQQIIANGSWVILILPLTWFMLHERSVRVRFAAELLVVITLIGLLGLGMVNENIPGWIGMPASLAVSIPQIRFTLKHGRGHGISVLAWIFLASSSYLWFTYGVGAGELPVIVNSGLAALLGTFVVVALFIRPAAIDVNADHSAIESSGDTELVAGGVGDVEVPLSPDRI